MVKEGEGDAEGVWVMVRESGVMVREGGGDGEGVGVMVRESGGDGEEWGNGEGEWE